jgi:diguanylate cyclase (GGDEF)-like protein
MAPPDKSSIEMLLDGMPWDEVLTNIGRKLERRLPAGAAVMICAAFDPAAAWASAGLTWQKSMPRLSPLEWPRDQQAQDAGYVSFATAGPVSFTDSHAENLALRARASGFNLLAHAAVRTGADNDVSGVVAVYFPQEPTTADAMTALLQEASVEVAAHCRLANMLHTNDQSNLRLAALAATVPGVLYQRVVKLNGEIRYTYISENAFELFGVTAERIINDPEALFQHYGPDYRRSFREKLLKASQDMSMWDVEATILHPDGRKRYTHALARPQKQTDGSVLWTGVILDSTRIKEAELSASQAETRTREAIIESLSQGLLMFDAHDRLMLCNSHFFALYPALKPIAVHGARYETIIQSELDPVINPDVTRLNANDELVDRLLRHGETHLVYEREMRGDRNILVNEYKTSQNETVVLYTDISELKQRERRIEHLAHHDALTGLPNRLLFRDKLEIAVMSLEHDGVGSAVLCLDLDRFKSVNDTLGHHIGDQLLKTVATRIEGCMREGDVACRLGGDEFAVILKSVSSVEQITSFAWRVLNAVVQPTEIQGHSLLVGTSIGIAVAGQDGDSAELLMKNADLALYRAKADGRGTFRFFEAEMDAKAQERRMMEIELRGAIVRGELEVHYQPLVDAHTTDIVGAEALVRWNHPTKGFIPPMDFIPLAEETGMISDIGSWVLRSACEAAAGWPNKMRVAVNISPAQFRNSEFSSVVSGILADTKLSPNQLELEITETMLLRNTGENLRILGEIKALGVRISMDDFGTGYSSLGNLRSFPFDKIKIDKSFISDLNKKQDAAAIIRAVLSLGRSLGMTTTAEGVETRDQLAYLRAEGCLEIQGHYYSKALSNADLMAIVGSGHGKATVALD